MSRNKWYWVLQVFGWTIYGLIGIAIAELFMESSGIAMTYSFVNAAMMLFSTHLFRHLLKLRNWISVKLPALLIRLLPIVIGCSIVINVINSLYYIYFTELFGLEDFSFSIYFLYVFQTTIYFLLWLGIYFGFHFFRNYKREEIEKWKLQTAVKDAELIALKAQINPHFLFNALNNIRALILEDQMKARDMVSHLSELLRYSIQFNNHEKVSVGDELQIVNKYLELESIHYEQRMNYTVESTEEVNGYKIPPMIIQLMAENSVKHGISQLKSGGEILISVTIKGDQLVIEVRNTGKIKSTENEGIGIKNATERIRILFDREPEFELIQDGDYVKSILKLPLQE